MNNYQLENVYVIVWEKLLIGLTLFGSKQNAMNLYILSLS